jgi:hypothetical protein
MSIETIPRTERYEFDHAIRDLTVSASRRNAPQDLARFTGRIMLRDCRERSGLDPRGRDQLSADDIEQLEAYFDFLREQYGIPKDKAVFPKAPKERRHTSRSRTRAPTTEVDDAD